MITRYKIISSKKLIIEYYCGKLTIDDVIELNKKVFNDSNFRTNFNVLMDGRYADFSGDEIAMLKYIQFMNDNKKFIKKRNVAILTSKPKEFVIATLFDINKGNLPINSKVFSTLKASLFWIDLPVEEYNSVKEVLSDLKRN